MKKLLLFILLVCATVQAYSQEYPKVVLSGDYPDPSVMRDGEDYYMTHSPFYLSIRRQRQMCIRDSSFSFLLRSRISHLALP